MRIAQVAPLYESVPPRNYGGTERVVSYLTEELVAQGHQVTLFASGDSVTSAELISPCDNSLRTDGGCTDPNIFHLLMLERVYREAHRFDVIHFHVDYLHFPLSRRQKVPTVTTLHGRLDIPELVPLYHEFPEMAVVSISLAQRNPLPWLNWQGTVYHGLPNDLFTFHDQPGDYLAFLGRVSPEKRLDRAIEIAGRAGMKLKIAAKVDKADHDYFQEHLQPMLNEPFVEFLGEVGGRKKRNFSETPAPCCFPSTGPNHLDWS